MKKLKTLTLKELVEVLEQTEQLKNTMNGLLSRDKDMVDDLPMALNVDDSGYDISMLPTTELLQCLENMLENEKIKIASEIKERL